MVYSVLFWWDSRACIQAHQKSFWIQGLGLRPWDSGFRVEGLGLFLNPLFLGFRFEGYNAFM